MMTLSKFNNMTEWVKKVIRKPNAKLLIVDDKPDNLNLQCRTFFNAFQASNGVEALEFLEKKCEVAEIISDQ